MTKNQILKIMSAMESAEIKNYMVVDDIVTRLYNCDTAIVKVDEADEMFIGIRANNIGGSHKRFDSNIEVVTMDFTDVHEIIVGADHDKIISFVENLGVSLSDDEKKLIITIDDKYYDIIPPTGDYNRFVPLTEEQYEKLTPEEKEAYNKRKAEEEEKERKYIGQHRAARITC